MLVREPYLCLTQSDIGLLPAVCLVSGRLVDVALGVDT